MKYLIDAQLPKRLSYTFKDNGYDAIHTLDPPDKNRTKDRNINSISSNEKRIVISKDSDFVDSILISDEPYKLLHVTTGNISNNELIRLFVANIKSIDQAFKSNRLITAKRISRPGLNGRCRPFTSPTAKSSHPKRWHRNWTLAPGPGTSPVSVWACWNPATCLTSPAASRS